MTSKDDLPPPYSEIPPDFQASTPVSLPSSRPSARNVIPRKPVNAVKPNPSALQTAAGDTSTTTPVLPVRETPRHEIVLQSVKPPQQEQKQFTSNGDSSTVATLQHGLRELKHFAGGLIHHPVESTKHFSILRHSSGLVYFSGSTTSIAVSIFSDAALPADHTIWLQSKGWTGHTGLKAKALLRSNADWLDVTPASVVDATQLPPDDERAWQRDISSFRRKATGSIAQHRIRATVIIHIPVEVQDGYWRLVLCDKKKHILCPSPVFRIASSSSAPASLRGASLGNLPLEIGASIVSSIAAAHASGLAQSLVSTVQGAIPYQPSFAEQEAGTLIAGEVYSRSGAADRVDSANAAYESARENTYTSTEGNKRTATLTDRYVDTRQQAMRLVDRAPTERLGIRMRKDELKGRSSVASGVYIWRG